MSALLQTQHGRHSWWTSIVIGTLATLTVALLVALLAMLMTLILVLSA